MIPISLSLTGKPELSKRNLTNSLFIRVEELAKKKNVSMSQIALAWLMAKDPVAAPIVGTTKIANIMDAISEFIYALCKIR